MLASQTLKHMKTKLPESINTIEDAKSFLSELVSNGESIHPDDDAHVVVWDIPLPPSYEECNKLNDLMSDCIEVMKDATVDCYDYLNLLHGHHIE